MVLNSLIETNTKNIVIVTAYSLLQIVSIGVLQ